ncbi:hypothetical protein LI291_10435 [Intestinibacillus massiliensis]|uniref:hypothetical protein n=1 Tax=Intestinibacillus massiliensis TaxID=1871029 RepID=UPI000B351762|nr:hypothetical protein [Intestinibacillus massiliensis]MCB6366588.1 hypothetical protein [Intestinibacillus massiliensis]
MKDDHVDSLLNSLMISTGQKVLEELYDEAVAQYLGEEADLTALDQRMLRLFYHKAGAGGNGQ